VQLAQLAAAAGQQGLVGAEAALPQLTALSCLLQAELNDASLFATFYRFVFFVARERGDRSLRTATACAAWHVLDGRFRLLDAFLRFVSKSGRVSISEDTWRQTLEFSRCVKCCGDSASNVAEPLTRCLLTSLFAA
jgi:DCN1-like protein 1/2